jgi:hypothetical protein
MENFSVALVFIALIGFAAFGQWLRHHRRVMIHRERLAAVEKGIELPPLEQEVQRSSWNVSRILLFAGLCWLSVGIGVFVVLSALLAHPTPQTADMLPGIQWVAIAPIGIGLSHLIVYAVGRKNSD